MRALPLILFTCFPAAADDGYRLLTASPQFILEVVDPYRALCPPAAGEDEFAWMQRCLPDDPFRQAQLRVIDGDTIAIGDEMIRIANIDAPETLHARCEAERRLGRMATRHLDSLLDLPFIKRTGTDRYGRTLGFLRDMKGRDIGELMIEAQFAVAYDGGQRINWCGPI